MSPEEKRSESPGFYNAVMIGVSDNWQAWAQECSRLDQSLDWISFFDGCALSGATGDEVTLLVTRAKYFKVAQNTYARRVLEQALFNTQHIPFHVWLTVGV